MARIKTMRFDGRRFGFKVGISQIAAKEYFDTAEKLQDKIVELESHKESYQQFVSSAKSPVHYHTKENHEEVLKKLDRLYRRLRAVESRTWTPMESFIIDRPSEDEVNIETFVKGHILAKIEGTHDERGISKGAESLGAAA